MHSEKKVKGDHSNPQLNGRLFSFQQFAWVKVEVEKKFLVSSFMFWVAKGMDDNNVKTRNTNIKRA